jgi:hypothetical protein
MRQSFELGGSELCGRQVHCLAGTKLQKISTLSQELQLTLCNRLNVEFDETESFISCKICIERLKITIGHVFVLRFVEEEEIPVFLDVTYLVNIRGTWLICGRLLISLKYFAKLHAYRAGASDSWMV